MVATLIADPVRADLTDAAGDEVRAALASAGANAAVAADWLADGVACDIAFEAEDLDAIRAAVRSAAPNAAYDLVVQPQEFRRKSLLLADMDSTIVTTETLDELAAHAGLKDRVAAITERAMRGEIDFKGAVRERVGMLKGLPVADLEKTRDATVLTDGARTLVRTMSANGAITVLISGGFSYFTRHVAALAGFADERSNELIVVDGRLTGEVREPILDRVSKLASLREIAAAHDIPMACTMAVGDGANDLPMILAAGLGVAFRAKPAVEAEAPAAIRHGDLTALLYLQGYRRAEFTTG